jgi:hypothetical protein
MQIGVCASSGEEEGVETSIHLQPGDKLMKIVVLLLSRVEIETQDIRRDCQFPTYFLHANRDDRKLSSAPVVACPRLWPLNFPIVHSLASVTI